MLHRGGILWLRWHDLQEDDHFAGRRGLGFSVGPEWIGASHRQRQDMESHRQERSKKVPASRYVHSSRPKRCHREGWHEPPRFRQVGQLTPSVKPPFKPKGQSPTRLVQDDQGSSVHTISVFLVLPLGSTHQNRPWSSTQPCHPAKCARSPSPPRAARNQPGQTAIPCCNI